ncbi:hypothetical protein [Escherichia coli]|uniref:hypothetical protein n=1 Tax=Escherichia coli TaxID=562 RepID=UPI001FCE95FB|nr:hypothetical protein [Escherichia coli]
MQDTNSDLNPNLKNSRVFNSRREKWGLPQEMVLVLLLVNLFALFLAVKYWSVFSALGMALFAVVTVMPMFLIHREDRDAHIVWRKVIFSSGNLSNSKTKVRKVRFISLNPTKGNVHDSQDVK